MYNLLPNTFTCVNVILVFHWIEAWGSLSVLAGLFVVDSTRNSFTSDVYVTALYPVLSIGEYI